MNSTRGLLPEIASPNAKAVDCEYSNETNIVIYIFYSSFVCGNTAFPKLSIRKRGSAKLSIRKRGSSSVLIICDLFNSHALFIYKSVVIFFVYRYFLIDMVLQISSFARRSQSSKLHYIKHMSLSLTIKFRTDNRPYRLF
jgi:hypothetical protein